METIEYKIQTGYGDSSWFFKTFGPGGVGVWTGDDKRAQVFKTRRAAQDAAAIVKKYVKPELRASLRVIP